MLVFLIICLRSKPRCPLVCSNVDIVNFDCMMRKTWKTRETRKTWKTGSFADDWPYGIFLPQRWLFIIINRRFKHGKYCALCCVFVKFCWHLYSECVVVCTGAVLHWWIHHPTSTQPQLHQKTNQIWKYQIHIPSFLVMIVFYPNMKLS